MNAHLDGLLEKLLKEHFNLERGDSGFDFGREVRDITFHDEEGTEVEITYRIKYED